MKQCRACKNLKTESAFSKDARTSDNLQSKCKDCDRVAAKSESGVIRGIYSRQIVNSRNRGHSHPEYSESDLSEWLYSHGFKKLYDDYFLSGFLKDKAPSVDRLDDSLGYCFSNIRLVTWSVNNKKGYKTRVSKKVSQLSINGEFISLHESALLASNATGASRTSIARCCRGASKTAGGFKWRYSK